MACEVVKFTLTRGVDNTFIFTIKKDGATVPIVITNTDNFSASLVPLDPVLEATNTVVLSIATPTTGTDDANNGRITLTIPEAVVNTLLVEKGTKSDRFYARPVYKLIIECQTADNGNFIAKVPEVYVD